MNNRIVWIARDLKNGPMCYVLFSEYPVDLANELAEKMIGRELRVGELVKLELGEVEQI